MNLNEEIVNAISAHDLFSISLFGYKIPVSDTVVVTWIIMAFLIIISIILTRKMKIIPEGRQNVAESVVELINNFTEGAIGHHWRHFAPYLGTIMLFLIFSNIISVFDIIPNWNQLYNITNNEAFKSMPLFSLRPPTKNVNVTAAMAIMSIVLVIYSAIRFKRLSGWVKSLVRPTPIMLPFNILDYIIRPLSLCLRLFGNILAAFVIMELIYIAFPPVIPAAFSMYFDLFDGALQAYIFVFLTSLYIAEAVE